MRTDRNYRVNEMTDREYRAYKRQCRIRRERRRKVFTLFLTVCLIVICAGSYHSIVSSAKSGSDDIAFKYYTDITVAAGDTLWDIADEYIDYEQYKDKDSYITEVRSINHIAEDASIRAGQNLIVPYYSHEFVK